MAVPVGGQVEVVMIDPIRLMEGPHSTGDLPVSQVYLQRQVHLSMVASK